MTNNIKPFDLEAAKRGEPVVTRDGRKVRIVCFDANPSDGESKIVALINYGQGDSVYMFKLSDLFMAGPVIPEGFTAYDPNVPPPENAEEIEMIYERHDPIKAERSFFIRDWSSHNQYARPINKRIAYRVTKWKEAKPSLEEFIEYLAVSLDNPKQDVLEVVNRFADAIVQRAVDKVRDAQ